MHETWAYSALASFGVGIFVLVYTLGRNEAVITPRLGMRGFKRQLALTGEGSFKSIEPLMRFTASWVAYLPLGERRRQIDELIKHAGGWLGLTANELIALCILGGFAGMSAGATFAFLFDLPPILALGLGGLGSFLPYSRCRSEMERRFREVNRALPGAIDLASLCMGAGLDFPGSIRQIVEKSGRKETLIEEFEFLLRELDLGRTRRQALENFADRVPTEAVRDFVGAVVQAEQKGNPLSEVLRIQARMLRMRRSVAAEEAAARAALMMMGPLMLIFMSVMIIIMGPFVIQMSQVEGGF